MHRTAPSSFLKRLKNMDKKLGCQWNYDLELFEITYKRSTGVPIALWVCKTKDNKFRWPDERDIKKLWESDTARESWQDKVRRSAQYMADYQEQCKRRAAEEIRYATRYNKNQLVNIHTKAAGYGKGNSTYRRITPKVKGQVFG